MTIKEVPSSYNPYATDESDEMSTAQDMNSESQDCFDPRTCCDEYEQILIETMRAILRPDQAPECLYERLRVTLDECCCETTTEHTVIRHTVIRNTDESQ